MPARPLSPDEAEAHFGALAPWVMGDGQASSERTRAVLGWEPQGLGLLADIGRPGHLG